MSDYEPFASDRDGFALLDDEQEALKKPPRVFRLLLKALELVAVVLDIVSSLKNLLLG